MPGAIFLCDGKCCFFLLLNALFDEWMTWITAHFSSGVQHPAVRSRRRLRFSFPRGEEDRKAQEGWHPGPRAGRQGRAQGLEHREGERNGENSISRTRG